MKQNNEIPLPVWFTVLLAPVLLIVVSPLFNHGLRALHTGLFANPVVEALIWINLFLDTVGTGLLIAISLYLQFATKNRCALALVSGLESIVLFAFLSIGRAMNLFSMGYMTIADFTLPATAVAVFVAAAIFVCVSSKGASG